MKSVRAIVGGLNTSPGENVTAESGALREASNVIISRPGLATPRPGFGKLGGQFNDSTEQALNLFVWPAPSGTDPVVLRNNGDDTVSFGATPLVLIDDEDNADLEIVVAAAPMRGNLYIAAGELASPQVRKLTSSSDTRASLAGISAQPIAWYAYSAGAGTVLANDDRVSYRACILKRDDNDLVVRGPSTGHLQFRNSSGATIDPSVSFVLPEQEVAAGDVVEVYRTRGVAAAPGNDYYLCYSRQLTSSDITAGGFTFTDSVEDADLGAALYTNDSREGVMGCNFRPPGCVYLAEFRGSMFYGSVTGPARISLTFNEGGDRSGQATGIGYRTITGTFTNASADITLASSTTGLQVGMILSSSSGWSATPCRITAIVGATITMNGTYTGAGGASSRMFCDSVRVGSEYFPAYSAGALVRTINSDVANLSAASTTYVAYAIGKFVQWNTSSQVEIDNVQVVIEERKREATEASIYATHGDEYFPPLPLPNATATDIATLRYDRFLNGIAWSKQHEPEHVPLPNFAEVGDKDNPIVGLVPTRDALWIFKTDGLWRLTGSGSPFWRIDPYDPTLRSLHQLCFAKMDDRIYAWTNRGIVECGDGIGVNVISGPIEDRIELAQSKMSVATWLNYYDHGSWMTADPNLGVVLVGVSETARQGYAQRIYCYSVATKQWSEWRLPFSMTGEDPDEHYTGINQMVYDARTGTLVASCINTGSDVVASRQIRDINPPYADYTYTPTVTVTSTLDATYGTNLQVTAGTWTPQLGDVFTHSGTTYIVVQQHSATRCVVEPSTPTITAQAVTVYSSFECELQWQRFGAVGSKSQTREVAFTFDESRGIERVDAEFASESGATYRQEATKEITYRSIDTTERFPAAVRFVISRSVSRAATFFATLKVKAARAPFAVSGVSAMIREYTSRVTR